MGELFEQLTKRNINGQFFTEFTHKTGFKTLARFAFAARKLPQTR